MAQVAKDSMRSRRYTRSSHRSAAAVPTGTLLWTHIVFSYLYFRGWKEDEFVPLLLLMKPEHCLCEPKARKGKRKLDEEMRYEMDDVAVHFFYDESDWLMWR